MRRAALVAALCGLLGLAAAARADTAWVLWERSLDYTGQADGDWSRKQVFEGERWCKGAMTNLVNLTLMRKKKHVAEYQCLPETADPRAVKKP